MTLPVGGHTDRTYINEDSLDVEQTRYPVCDTCVYRAKNYIDANDASYPSVGSRTK